MRDWGGLLLESRLCLYSPTNCREGGGESRTFTELLLHIRRITNKSPLPPSLPMERQTKPGFCCCLFSVLGVESRVLRMRASTLPWSYVPSPVFCFLKTLVYDLELLTILPPTPGAENIWFSSLLMFYFEKGLTKLIILDLNFTAKNL